MVIELLAIEDVTPGADLFEDKESADAIERATRTSGRYNFLKFGIPIGAELEYARDSAFTATVYDENSIMFQGEIVSPSKAAVMANQMRGGTATALPGPLMWVYEGESLSAIRRAQLEQDEDGLED